MKNDNKELLANDYFCQKKQRNLKKIQEIINTRFAYVNEKEEEMWKKFQVGDVVNALGDILGPCDERFRLDLLGLMFEKRKNKDVEFFLSSLLSKLGRSKVCREGMVFASNSGPRKEFLGRLLPCKFLMKRYPILEFDPAYYTNISTIVKVKAVSKVLTFFSTFCNHSPCEIIIASETVLNVGGMILGPFGDGEKDFDDILKENAVQQIQSLLGKQQIAYSSLVVFDSITGQLRISNDRTGVLFKDHSPECDRLINEYIARANGIAGPMGKAGGYGLQDPQILRLAQRIEGDPLTVIGFPFEQLAEMFKQMKIPIELVLDWDEIYRKIWREPELVEIAKKKIVLNNSKERAGELFKKMNVEDLSRLIVSHLGSVPLSIVELAANVGYFSDIFAQSLIERGSSVEKVTSTDVEIRHDIRIKEIDINSIGTEHPGEFNIVLVNYPPGPEHIDWDTAFRSIKKSIKKRGIVVWASIFHKTDKYKIAERMLFMPPGSKILKIGDDLAVLLMVNDDK